MCYNVSARTKMCIFIRIVLFVVKTYGLMDILKYIFYGRSAMPECPLPMTTVRSKIRASKWSLETFNLRVKLSNNCCTNFFTLTSSNIYTVLCSLLVVLTL